MDSRTERKRIGRCPAYSRAGLALAGLAAIWLAACNTVSTKTVRLAPKWDRFEAVFASSVPYTNPVQEASLTVVLTSPSGETRTVPGFWDGGKRWRVRFSPNEVGTWNYTTHCSDMGNRGLHERSGSFVCSAPIFRSRFDRHGPVRISRDGRFLAHEDGTPFFWLADTGWNAALLSTPAEWDLYLRERARQKFTAIQWVATQWRAAPKGNWLGESAFSGREKIAVNPVFFQRLDAKVEQMNRMGLLCAPVLLWAIGGGSSPEINPGFGLPEDQAIILARYMVARWGANDVFWILGGDGDYRADKADRWKRIGRAVFDGIDHAPVTMHPGGMHWVLNEFGREPWYGVAGYQSGHGDDDRTLRWIYSGPPATDWKQDSPRPFINLEPPYENHLAYQSRQPHSAASVRRTVYWSLLSAPPAGVTYGGHGVWGWDDGTRPPTDHANTGIPFHWRQALTMPGAEQMAVVADFFSGLEFWRLRPEPGLLIKQPGAEAAARHISAARTEQGDLAVVYVPVDRTVSLRIGMIPPSPGVTWINPRNGEKSAAVAVVYDDVVEFATPAEGDWLLLLKTEARPGP